MGCFRSRQINEKDGLNALHIAARYGPVEIVQELLSRGASPDTLSLKRNVALHYASLGGKSDIVERLLRARADYDAQNLDGNTPLYMAAQEGHVACIRLLLKAGANSSIDTNGSTPLDVALQQNKLEAAALLINTDPRVKDKLSLEEIHKIIRDVQQELTQK